MTKKPIFETSSPGAQKLEALRLLFPQAVETDEQGRVRINAAQIQLAVDPTNSAALGKEEDGYELRWVGKREAYHKSSESHQKILNPLPSESKAWDSTGNLLIKGDNLDALKLLRQSYFGQIKLIYIDPPYNTTSDAFIYRDDFTQKQGHVLEQLGYSEDALEYVKNIYGARTHSGWLSFMYPRLLLAKDLLRDDGVIFISIDDNEQAQLKLLCDEVFGQENFAGKFPWRKRTAKSDVPYGVSQDYEWIICYAKADFLAGQPHERNYYSTPDFPNDRWRTSDLTKQTKASDRENSAFDMVNPKNGALYKFNPKRSWSITKDTFPLYLEKQKIVFPGDYDFLNIDRPAFRVFESEDREKSLRKRGSEDLKKALSTLLPEKVVGRSEHGNKDFSALFETEFFSFPKPVNLIAHLVDACLSDDEMCLDFFAGSGTTGEAVMRLNAEDGGNRKFILVQIPQPIDAKKQKEAHEFVTKTLGKSEATIFEITAERLRRAGAKIEAELEAKDAIKKEASDALFMPASGLNDSKIDTGFRVYELTDDPNALILHKSLADASQADVLALQEAIATPQPAQEPQILANLLLAEGLSLSSNFEPLLDTAPHAIKVSGDVAFVLHAVPLEDLVDALRARKAQGQAVQHICVYAPWIADDNFLQGISTLLEAEGYGPERLRLRG